MAHHSKFLSVNLNKSYGKPSSPSSATGYVNGRPRSAGGGGGMVVLSRPRSSSGAAAHKPSPRLAVPPPVNLPSLRKEHERLDPALSKTSSGHGGSGLGIGNSSSMSWTKPTPPMQDFSDKNGGLKTPSTAEQRSFSGSSQAQGFTEKTMILRGEDFPSLMATSTYVSKQKQKQVNENSVGLAGKSELSSVVDMSLKLRSSPPTKRNVQGSEGGSSRVLDSLEQPRQGGGNFPSPLPLVRLRHISDWDDDERDRNRVDHYDGAVFPDIEAHSSLSRDSGRGDPYGKDHNFSSWRATVEPNRDISSSRALHVDKDHFGPRNSAWSKGTSKESSHDRSSYGDRKEFGSGVGIGDARVTEGSNNRAQFANNWQRGKPYTNSMIQKGISTNDPVQKFAKEKISNVGRYYAEDGSWGGDGAFSGDAVLVLKAKVLRQKKEAVKHTDIFDPARESFEAELERVQWLQEQERRRVMEEQARVMEVARREAEERERIAREEEERRQFLEEEARESAWRAEQEKLEAARRAEELRIAREEEKKKILMEEERRKEAARQKLLELEAKIASRQTEAVANDRMKERNSSRDSDLAKCEKNETIVEHLANSIVKIHDQDSGFSSNRSFHRKQLLGIHGPKPVAPPFKRGISGDQPQTGHSWDRNRDCDQFNGRSNVDAMIGGWDSYSERSFQNSEVDDVASFSRARHTIRQPHVPPPPPLSASILKNSRGDASVGSNSSLSGHSDARINQSCRDEDYSYHQRVVEPGEEPRRPELMEEPASSLLQTEEKNSPRYDSQSSLSISNPPSSPTQLSHDEFDDCGCSPAIATSAEEENSTFSVDKSMVHGLDAGKIDAKIVPFSHGEDDDWAIADNEKMQEEDHDEGPDSNQEDNEAHESDGWELQMKNKSSDHYLFIKDSEYHEKMSTNAGHGRDSSAQNIFANISACNLQSEETVPDKILNNSSDIVEETVKEQEDMIFSPVSAATHPTDVIRASKNSCQNPIAAVSRFPLPSTSSLSSISASVTASSGQNDVPAKLQFGLFSSPPLIPSPLPTIQIGSIQTPLPLNTRIDSYTHMHPSNAPLFQFGQIAYTPAASQSVLPIAAPTLPYTHHSPMACHLINANTVNQVSQDSTTTKGLDRGQLSTQSNLDVPRGDALISKRPITLAASDDKDFHHPDDISKKNFRSTVYSKRMRGRPQLDSFSSARRSLSGLNAPGTIPDIRGNRLAYNVRNAGVLSTFTRTETPYVYSNRPQRRVQRHIQGTEYRVKDSGARQMQSTESFNHGSYSGKLNYGDNLAGVPSRNVGKKGAVINKSTKMMNEEAVLSGSQVVGTDSNMSRDNRKEILQISMPTSSKFHGGEGDLKKNGLLEDDIDAPLLSGIVRVFNQPGIEASSDGDGFVEVRSKRKISNERRGQREREIIPNKQKVTRVPHRPRAALSSNGIAYKSDMVTTLTVGAAAKSLHSGPAIAHRRPSSDMKTMAAIGSSDLNSADYDSQLNSLKSSHAGSDSAIASDGANGEPSLSFGNNIALDKVSVPLGTWGAVHLNQQEASSTQSQLDGPSNSVQCNPNPVGAAKVSSDDKNTKEKPSFSSVNLPNFPFDGEKIQFGAVSSTPPLPPSSQPAPTGIWSPGSVILNSSIIHSLPVSDHGVINFFDDTEAEAEAAASAVAVAVITNDEITASTIGASAISGIGAKGLTCPGPTSCADTACKAASKESLIVTLPSDLSVTTPLSLWPPLPAIRSSRPMLSDIAGPPQTSPFPFFDSSPMLGGPILSFRPQDESAGTWPHCPSGVESSFYGSPAGFAAPFMSPPAGLSGVPGHAPMVFYNHFAPFGQFGQVGLSYMGGAYVPTGKQPDWKHSSDGAATANASKVDPGNLSVVYGQQNAAHVPTPIQHLSAGSGVMQVTSPFTLFNLRPFQSSTEIQVPAQWPPAPHPHSPNSIRLSTAPEHLRSLPPDLPHSTAADLPDELTLVEPSSSNSINAQAIQSSRTHSTNTKTDLNAIIIPNSAIGKSSSSQKMSSGGHYGQRSAFHGKYGNNKSNKGAASSKMKQIYVAKSLLTTAPGTSS